MFPVVHAEAIDGDRERARTEQSRVAERDDLPGAGDAGNDIGDRESSGIGDDDRVEERQGREEFGHRVRAAHPHRGQSRQQFGGLSGDPLRRGVLRQKLLFDHPGGNRVGVDSALPCLRVVVTQAGGTGGDEGAIVLAEAFGDLVESGTVVTADRRIFAGHGLQHGGPIGEVELGADE